MAWKCDLCDSYNEDSLSVCYVCGEARSAASILAEEMRRKEDALRRKEALRTKFCADAQKVLGKSGRVLYYGAMAVAILALVLMLALKVAQGQTEDLWITLSRTADRGLHHLEELLLCADETAVRIADGPLQSLPDMGTHLLERVGENLGQLLRVLEVTAMRIFE
jgi:hypothetical protein